MNAFINYRIMDTDSNHLLTSAINHSNEQNKYSRMTKTYNDHGTSLESTTAERPKTTSSSVPQTQNTEEITAAPYT